DEISIADIICAVDEWVEFTRCGGNRDCQDGKRCLTHNLWDDLSNEIFSFLQSITLAELVERGGLKEHGCRKEKERESIMPRADTAAA
ncbi:MAG: Rrf2 family transcriptional regulator, partial [Sedimenticola sp.]|nr:Rrf2 family transcriptional regulator [Sedimenticola sp.]